MASCSLVGMKFRGRDWFMTLIVITSRGCKKWSTNRTPSEILRIHGLKTMFELWWSSPILFAKDLSNKTKSKVVKDLQIGQLLDFAKYLSKYGCEKYLSKFGCERYLSKFGFERQQNQKFANSSSEGVESTAATTRERKQRSAGRWFIFARAVGKFAPNWIISVGYARRSGGGRR